MRLKISNGIACCKPVIFVTPLDIKITKCLKDMRNVVCFEGSESFIEKPTYSEKNQDISLRISKTLLKRSKSTLVRGICGLRMPRASTKFKI